MKNKKVYLILFIIMLAGIVRFSYGFFVEKQGTHADEVWSYGLANSYYEPFIESPDNSQKEKETENIYEKNIDEWLSGDVMSEYLTVQEDERFSFDSVYYNQSCDVHPPLYYYILHFLSSFFVDEYIPALAFLINVISYIIMSVFLYKLVLLISKSKLAGILCVLFNTFTMGTLSMMVFMRMYTMLAMFAVVLAYLNAKIYYIKDCRDNLSTYIELIIITLLGALTHHYFLPYAFIITAIMCICWLIKRDRKTLIKYSICMLLGAGLSILLFPATLDHMFGIDTVTFSESSSDSFVEITTEEVETSVSLEETTDIEHYKWKLFKYMFALCFQIMFRDEIGCSPVSPFSRGILCYTPLALIILAILFLAVNFIFRHEIWYINLKQKGKKTIIELPIKTKHFFKNFNWFLMALFISIVFILLITIFARGNIGYTITTSAEYTNRYFFIIYPIFSIIFTYLIYLFFAKLIKRRACIRGFVISAIVGIFFILSNVLNGDSVYLIKDSDSVEYFESIAEDSDFIVVASTKWIMQTYTNLLYNSNQFFYVISVDDIYNYSENLSNYSSDGNLYVVFDISLGSYDSQAEVDNEIETTSEYITKLLGKDECEFVHSTYIYGRLVYIYQITGN